jgi:MFS family permease
MRMCASRSWCVIPRPYMASTSIPAARDARVFYGWAIAAASALGIGCGVSVFLPSTIGLMIEPLHREFGWTPPQIILSLSFATVSTVLVAPFIGSLVDRFGVRAMIAFSFAAEALLIGSFGSIGPNIHFFYLRYAALAILATGTTALTFSALLSRWFDRRRGLALGIALAGLGVGGVFWSLVTQSLFTRVGWRSAFPDLAAIVGVVVLPILLLTIRERPTTLGLAVDGDVLPAQSANIPGTPGMTAQPPVIHGCTLRQALASRQYWLIVVAFALISMATYGFTLNLIPLLRGQGQSAQTAAAAQASMWAVLVVGRVSTGWLMDRYFAPRVALAYLIPAVLGMILLLASPGGAVAFAAAMLVGISSGAEVDVLAYLAGRYFGLRHFGAIYATLFSIYAVGTSVGPLGASWLAAQLGSYNVPLVCLAVALCAAGGVLWVMRPFPQWTRAE